MIRCKNLCLEYPDGASTRTIFENVNIEVKKGENVVLLGPSGSGKSSMIYLLSSLRKPTGGEIYFHDIELTNQSENKAADIRKNHFAYIFQMHFLLPYLTILENVLVARNDYSEASKEQAVMLLSKLGLDNHINKKIHQLSGGERQRVAIARALINEPDIIFADEPTASLDHQKSIEVFNILKSYKKDSTLIMATHDTSILTGEERLIRVYDGKVEDHYKLDR